MASSSPSSRRIVLRHFSLDMATIQPPPSPTPRGHFSLDFLPRGGAGGSTWEIADRRGSLLLVYRGAQLYSQLGSRSATSRRTTGHNHMYSPGLVVCDPLARRYKEIPCPRDLAGHQYLGLFLLDGGASTTGDETHQPDGGECDRIGMSNFRVMAALHRPHACEPGRGVPAAYVFSPASDDAKCAWGRAAFSAGRPGDWHFVKRAWRSDIDVPSTIESFYFAGRAHGSFYWGIKGGATGGGDGEAALVLDEATAGFSMGMLPEDMLGSSYDLPVRRPAMPTDRRVRSATAAENNAVAVARACAKHPGLMLLLISFDRQGKSIRL